MYRVLARLEIYGLNCMCVCARYCANGGYGGMRREVKITALGRSSVCWARSIVVSWQTLRFFIHYTRILTREIARVHHTLPLFPERKVCVCLWGRQCVCAARV